MFSWFGILKFFPGLSPAEQLAGRTIEQITFGMVTSAVALPILAAWECLIGIGLLFGIALRATLLLLFAQMFGEVLNETFPGGRRTPSGKHHHWDRLFIRVSAADK